MQMPCIGAVLTVIGYYMALTAEELKAAADCELKYTVSYLQLRYGHMG
jgi:hypothetical protein